MAVPRAEQKDLLAVAFETTTTMRGAHVRGGDQTFDSFQTRFSEQ